jgi:outer membrane lipoprotein-sorting protein
MMRRVLLLGMAMAMVVAGATAAAGQTVDELVTRNLDAKGGLAKLRSVQTVKQSSHITMQGMEAVLTVFGKRPNLVRQEMTIGGKLVISAYDGVVAWMVNPLVGTDSPMMISGPQADLIREQSNFDGPLVDYRTKGYVVEFIGKETVDGTEAYHLRLTSPTQQVMHLYLDAKTGLDLKLVSEMNLGRLEQVFSDYRDVDGIKVPFTIRTLVNGVPQSEIKVDSVEFNVPIDNAVFRMPKGLFRV